jgi:hypothetical protein
MHCSHVMATKRATIPAGSILLADPIHFIKRVIAGALGSLTVLTRR